MTIRVTINNNISRKTYDVDSSTTLRDVIDAAKGDGLSFANETIQINGTNLNEADLGSTFESFGYTGEPGQDRVFLLGVVKEKNA